jgi:hypothetical protein
MIISDLDYLDSISDTSAMLVNGGIAIASSEFSANTRGIFSNTTTRVENLAQRQFNTFFALSRVRVIAMASGGNPFSHASASSTSLIS